MSYLRLRVQECLTIRVRHTRRKYWNVRIRKNGTISHLFLITGMKTEKERRERSCLKRKKATVMPTDLEKTVIQL
ncbi:hypothetical protein D3C84_1040630 [compost metagenome]